MNAAKAITKQKNSTSSRDRPGRRKYWTYSCQANSDRRRPAGPEGPSWPTGFVAGSRKTVARMLTAERPAESRMGTASPKPDSAPEMAGPTRKPIPKLTPMIAKERVRFSGSVTSAM